MPHIRKVMQLAALTAAAAIVIAATQDVSAGQQTASACAGRVEQARVAPGRASPHQIPFSGSWHRNRAP